jgi:hypothetical protein
MIDGTLDWCGVECENGRKLSFENLIFHKSIFYFPIKAKSHKVVPCMDESFPLFCIAVGKERTEVMEEISNLNCTI